MATKSVEQQLQVILDQFAASEGQKIHKVFKDTAKDCANEIKNSDIGNGDYVKSWTYTAKKLSKFGAISCTVYARPPYHRLTHLLEKGHAIANQFGSYPGRVPAHPHISTAEDKYTDELFERLKREL